MRKFFLLIFISSVLVACNARKEFQTFEVDGDRAYELCRQIVAIGPRPSGSNNNRKTAQFIIDECKKLGITAKLDEWKEKTAHGEMEFRNVYAEISGSEDGTIILCTHFDTKLLKNIPQFEGANDSGSSTALVLEIMRVLKENEEQWDGPTIMFAFFDGEECVKSYTPDDGLHGSRRLANAIEQNDMVKDVKAMVLLDMIGDKDLELTLSPDDDPTLRRLVKDIAKQQGVSKHVRNHRSIILDDHVPFKEIGIPAIDLIDFEFGPRNSYWHTSEDTMDKISPTSLAVVGNLTIRLLQEIGQADL